MTFKISFIENTIETSNEYVRCLEIENKNYFYRVVKLLNDYFNNQDIEEELIITEKLNFKIVTDYFNIDLNDKKTINLITKYIKEHIDETNYENLLKNYQKLNKIFQLAVMESINLPIVTEKNVNLDNIIKVMNIKITEEGNLLKKLYTLIDLITELQNYELLIFVNLKQFLSKEELNEYYKYAIYNHVSLLLIDNISYGIAQNYEKKLIIDDNLEEFIV